jgi:hypothetical protein
LAREGNIIRRCQTRSSCAPCTDFNVTDTAVFENIPTLGAPSDTPNVGFDKMATEIMASDWRVESRIIPFLYCPDI